MSKHLHWDILAKSKVIIGIMLVVVAISMAAWGLYQFGEQPQYLNEQTELQIKEYDVALGDLAEICAKDLEEGVYDIASCDSELKESWDTYCKEFGDTLASSCTKVEDYLRTRGII